MITPGELYWADFEDVPPHPVVVVSREELNRGDSVVAVLITSAHFERRSRLPNCVPIAAGSFGLGKDCVAQAETIFSIRKAHLDLDAGPIGMLDEETFRALIRAIGHVLRSDCEPE